MKRNGSKTEHFMKEDIQMVKKHKKYRPSLSVIRGEIRNLTSIKMFKIEKTDNANYHKKLSNSTWVFIQEQWKCAFTQRFV